MTVLMNMGNRGKKREIPCYTFTMQALIRRLSEKKHYGEQRERERPVASNHIYFIKCAGTNFISLPPAIVIQALQGKLLGSPHNKIDEVTTPGQCAQGQEVSKNSQESG